MFIILSCALLLDYLFSQPHKYHPLTGFKKIAAQIEMRLNDPHVHHKEEQLRVNGFMAVLICLVPAWFLTDFLTPDNFIGYTIEILVVFLVIDLSHLKQQAQNIYQTLQSEQTESAQSMLTDMTGLHYENMDNQTIARTTTELVLAKANDRIFAAIFWFLVAGAPGIVVYKLSSILDSLWGHKNEHFKAFGYFIAKLDDLFNYIPARLTAITYAFMGNWHHATRCWSRQAPFWDSPNHGVVIAAGAGALGVQLGGNEQFEGRLKERPGIGCGKPADAQTIMETIGLLNRSTLLWVFVSAVISLIVY